MAGEQPVEDDWAGHTRGSAACGRLLAALACAGVATFAQLYSPQAVLPLISSDLHVGAANAALVVSASTVGLAIGVIPWSALADRIGRVNAISISVTVAVICGVAALGFVRLAPDPREFTPEGSLGRRLAANLRTPRQLVLFTQGFLLMGGFVALYNFLGFYLTRAPFHLAPSVVSLMFLAYLAGTWASSRAGAEVTRFGRKRVLLASVSIMLVGVAMTLSTNIIAVLVGLVVATAGFFGAHSTASGWTGQAAPVGKARASSLYNLFYYGGSSAVGWLGGVAFDAYGWVAVAATIAACIGIAAALAALFLRDTV